MRLLMTVTMTMSASTVASRHGNSTFDCGGARIRVYSRHLATVVTIQGDIDTRNVGRISAYARRFILAKTPVVLDLSEVNSLAAEGMSLLQAVDDACRGVEVEWTLVASPAVIETLRDFAGEAMFPVVRSVHEALHGFADAINRRRELLLPLIGKTA
jgi:anti-anti-sigma regulatory factor